MTDEIKLPPLPSMPLWLVPSLGKTLEDYARLAVEQDRARREGRGPHRKVLRLYDNGQTLEENEVRWQILPQHNIILRWTPERAWIESARNRELARKLRHYSDGDQLDADAADALDGGEQ